MINTETEIEKFIRLPEVMSLVGLKRSAIYQKMQKNEFPKPYKITKRAVAWLLSDIQHWISEQLQPT